MRRKLGRTLLTTLLAAAALLAVGSGSAVAQSSDGAVVVNEADCVTYAHSVLGSYEYCYDYRYEYNVTQTPSGNYNYESNGRSSSSVTAAGCTGASDSASHYHSLYNVPKTQEYHSSYKGQSRFDCPVLGLSYTCTYTQHVHFANGRVQFSRPDSVCSPL
jgi:hypothetical protein